MIELMFVVAIIGVLAAIAIPNFSTFRHKAIVVEGLSLAEPVKKDILEFYAHVGRMPATNDECGQPDAKFITGKYVASLTVTNGSIDVLFNDSFSGPCKSKSLVLTPVSQPDNPSGLFTWQQETCGQ